MRNREKITVEQMITLYCRKKEGNKELCRDCRELLEYALLRLEKCRYGDGKPACKKCSTHCYRPQQRERIREIMRYSGPRMVWYHPCEALKHFFK